MKVNGMDMETECSARLDEYIKEVEIKNKVTITPEHKADIKKIFDAGFSGCLETILPKGK